MKKRVSLVMTFVLLVTLINITSVQVNYVKGADDLFNWNKNDTIDTTLTVVENKASDDEIFLECQMEQSGTYTLVYYLEDSRRTTVEFDQQYDSIQVFYMVEEIDATISPAQITNITQDLLDNSYLEMDYELAVPDWTYVEDKAVSTTSGTLEFTINYSAGTEYPGVAFEIDNKRVTINWKAQTDELYYMISSCEEGKIMPISYTTPSGETQETKILRSLEDFQVEATHIIEDGSDIKLIEGSDTIESPGSRPGLELTFQQPQELDETDWVYKESLTNLDNISAVVELADIGSNDYIDFFFELNTSTNSTIKTIHELPAEEGANNNVEYSYDAANYEYQVDIIKDKSDLLDQEKIIQWSELEASKIYNVSIGFQIDAEDGAYDAYEFADYEPVNGFAYTYLQYDVKRANMSEAYLDIVPYDVGNSEDIQYTILYSKVKTTVTKPDLDPDDNLWVDHYYDGDENDNIYIPVPFNSESSQDVYQVIVEFSGVDLKSQVLNYSAIDDENVPPSTPSIEAIDNLYVVPSENHTDTEPSKVQVDLVWEAPDNTDTMELNTIFANKDDNPDNDRIYYELLINDVPEDTEENPFEVIKVFEVYKEGDDYKVQLHDNVTGDATASEISYYDFGYNESEELFRMENISIFDEDVWSNTYNVIADDDTNTYDVVDSSEPYNYEFPGVNYIRLRAISKSDGEIGISDNSIAVSLSLGLTDYEIPIPSGLYFESELEDVQQETVGITFNFHSVNVETYEESMLEPIDKRINSVKYGVYISEDRDSILNVDETNPSYSAIVMESDTSVVIDTETLDLLRDDEVIFYELGTDPETDKELSTVIDGLDVNTNYYIRVVTFLDIIDLDDSCNEIRYGEFSNMLSVTTPNNIEEPSDDETKPLAMENFDVSSTEDSDILSLVSWDYPKEILFDEYEFGFEVISIQDSELGEAYDSITISLEEMKSSEAFIKGLMEMWRVYVIDDESVLMKYNSETDRFEEQDVDLLSVNKEDNHIEFIDISNKPNTVYYYYGRTVSVSSGAINAASTWQKDSFTSSPIAGPVNLAVEYTSAYQYDEETEAIIRFDAPIPKNSDLINDYIMEIWIKGDDDLDYTDTKYLATFLGETDDGEDGYTRLYYRLGNLLSGNSYSVKVRIEDRTEELDILPDGSETYSVSGFSDRIIVRTEFNQEDYDKEVIHEDYIEYYEMKAAELLEDAYFTLSDTEDEHIVKYRDSYTTGELGYYEGDEYNLIVEDATKNVFYLPAEFIETVNDNNVTISVDSDDYSISIRPDSIGSGITNEIAEMEEEIEGYDSDVLDYYVKVEVNHGEYNNKISSRLPSSDVLNIQFDIVGSTELEDDIDAKMEQALENIISSHKSTVSSDLAIDLYYGIDEGSLLEIIELAVEEVRRKFAIEAEGILEDYLEDSTSTVRELDNKMFIELEPYEEDNDNDFYMIENGVWQNQNSTYYAGSYYIEDKNASSYILVSWNSSNSQFADMYSNDEVEVIYKYDLTEVFSSYDFNNPDNDILKYQMIASFARLLESGSANDTADYLEALDIDVNDDNMYASPLEEECLYVYIQVFAEKHNMDLENVRITDYNIIENIEDLDEEYRETFIQGANMTIIEPENNIISTGQGVSIEEFIYLLTKIENGLDW